MTISGLFYTVCIVIAIINLMYFKTCEHPFKNGAVGLLSGAAALIPASFLSGLLGGTLALNYSSLLISALLGVPGVILMTIYSVIR